MPIYIKIDDKNKAALAWLTKLIDNTFNANPNTRILLDHYEDVKIWHEALSAPLTHKDVMLWSEYDEAYNKEMGVKPAAKAVAKPVKKATKRTKARKKKEDPDPYSCKVHPTYSGLKQVPRSDCVKCWSLYKQFHPMDYTLKRRVFERKLANGK